MTEIHNKIREVIESEGIKMKPKWYFIMHAILVVLGLLFLFLISVFFISFFLFKQRLLPPHEVRDTLMSMQLTPWLLTGILVLMISVISFLNSEYNFVYKRPVIIVAFVLVLLTIAASFAIDKMTMHDGIRDRFKKMGPPIKFMDDMYNFERRMY